jgi:hypothetical protein
MRRQLETLCRSGLRLASWPVVSALRLGIERSLGFFVTRALGIVSFASDFSEHQLQPLG